MTSSSTPSRRSLQPIVRVLPAGSTKAREAALASVEPTRTGTPWRHRARDATRSPRSFLGEPVPARGGETASRRERNGKSDDADFFRIAAWDRQAQLCADYLAKGRKIGVEGRLRYRTWEDEGQKRSMVEVVAHRIEFLSAPSESAAEVVPFEAAVA